MSTSRLFRDLDPPAGGEGRLRQALAAPARARPTGLAPLSAAASLCLVAGLAWLAWRPASPPDLEADVRAALESVLRPPADGFEPRSAQLIETPSAPPGVRFYLLAGEGAAGG